MSLRTITMTMTMMSKLGTTIQLVGKTSRGKNIINKNGQMWLVLAETNQLLFSSHAAGVWLFITPIGKKYNDKSARWILSENDLDFLIT